MLYYFAPLEGITSAHYRNSHRVSFPGLDRYYAPFFVPGSKKLGKREGRELAPEHNHSLSLMPQVLCNRAEDLITVARDLVAVGYETINLNLGCPAGTVFTKKRGAGLLTDLDMLRRLLDAYCEAAPCKLSIKTRIGISSLEEWDALLSLYNDYPLAELVIHPRLREEYYRGTPHHDAFAHALAHSRAPVVYSGDLFTPTQVTQFIARYPTTHAIMLGRGLLANPALARMATGGEALSRKQLQDFHDLLYAGYQEILFGTKPIMHKMKELWHYMICLFPAHTRHQQQLHKAQTTVSYEEAVAAIFADLDFAPHLGYVSPETAQKSR